MEAPADQNAAIWQSDAGVQHYVSRQEAREAKRRPQWRLMAELLPYGEDEEFTVLDIGAGTGPAARSVLDVFARAHAVLADFSPQMMEEGMKSMAPYAGRYRYVEFDMTSGVWPDAIPSDLGAVVTSQCVHHVNDLTKQQLFLGVFDHLRPGGWYVNFDPVNTDDAVVEEAWRRANAREDPEEAARETNRTPEEEKRHANHVRYMIPLEPQLDFLSSAGFEAVDIYWKHLDYVIYGGRKPA